MTTTPPRRSPASKIPKRLHSEESALMQLLFERLGWRFFEVEKAADRYPFYKNFSTGKGDVGRAILLVVPRTGLLALEMDRALKKREAAIKRKARNKKRRAARQRRTL